MIENLANYGVSPENALKPETLIVLRDKYEQMVTELDGEKAAAESEGETLLKKMTALVSTDENAEQVRILRDVLRETVWNAIDENEQLSVLLTETLQELKSEVMSERDYQLTRVKRLVAPVKVADDKFLDRKDEAATLAELIRALFVLLKASLPSTKAFKESFPLKERMEDDGNGNRNVPTGDFLPKLSKLPRTPGESAPVGRGATARRLRYSWNGEDLPADILLNDVAHDYVSDRKTGFIVDPRAIDDAVTKTGAKLFQEEKWTVEFPTGKLSGWLPSKK